MEELMKTLEKLGVPKETQKAVAESAGQEISIEILLASLAQYDDRHEYI